MCEWVLSTKGSGNVGLKWGEEGERGGFFFLSFLGLWHSEIERNWESLKRETEKKEGKNVSEGKR